MAMVERFEDLIAWQKARELTRDIYGATRQGTFVRDKRTEFHQFTCIAKGSCGEVRSDLYVALDVGHIDHALFDALYARTEEVGRIIGGLRLSLETIGRPRR